MPEQSLLALPALPSKIPSALNKTQLGTRRQEQCGFRGCDCMEHSQGRSTAVLSSMGAVPGLPLLSGNAQPSLQSLHGGDSPRAHCVQGQVTTASLDPSPRGGEAPSHTLITPARAGVPQQGTHSHLHHTGAHCTHSPSNPGSHSLQFLCHKTRVSLQPLNLQTSGLTVAIPSNPVFPCNHPQTGVLLQSYPYPETPMSH